MNNYSQVVDSVFVFGNKSSDGSQNPRNAKGFTCKFSTKKKKKTIKQKIYKMWIMDFRICIEKLKSY